MDFPLLAALPSGSLSTRIPCSTAALWHTFLAVTLLVICFWSCVCFCLLSFVFCLLSH